MHGFQSLIAKTLVDGRSPANILYLESFVLYGTPDIILRYPKYPRMAGVGSQTNQCKNPVFKLFAKITSLENYHLYSITKPENIH